MPILSGIIWNSESPKISSLSQKLLESTKNQVGNHFNVVKLLDNKGLIITGKHYGESVADKIVNTPNFCFVGRVYRNYSTHIKENQSNKLKFSDIPYSVENLQKDYWGRYIGASVNSSSFSLFRDPQGLLSMYWIKIFGVIIFASELSILYDCLEGVLELNYDYFKDFIIGEAKTTKATPFKNVYEVPPGHNVIFDFYKQPLCEPFWFPPKVSVLIQHQESLQQEISDEIIARLRYSLQCWVASVNGICLSLSGGLDSSALLLLLRDLIPEKEKLIAVNYKHSNVNASDESNEALEVANFCNTKLTIRDWLQYPSLAPIEQKIRCSRPSSELINQRSTQTTVSQIKALGNYEFMDGQGGDHLFLMPPPLETIVDYFGDYGIKKLHNVASDMSDYYRQPIWFSYKTLFKSFAQSYLQPNFISKKLAALPEWLNISKNELTTILSKPRWSFPTNTINAKSLGKIHHVQNLQESVFYRGISPLYGVNPVIHPLMSQPLVEYILSLPTYIFFSKEYDRILFRNAINDWKPNPFVWRKTKGETTGAIEYGLQENFTTTCELCLDGRLAQQGFINKELLYKCLLGIRAGKPTDLWPVINLLACEIWFQNWGL